MIQNLALSYNQVFQKIMSEVGISLNMVKLCVQVISHLV